MTPSSGNQRRRPPPIEIEIQQTVEHTVTEQSYPPGWRGEVVTSCYSDHDPRYNGRERERDPEHQQQAPPDDEPPAMSTLGWDMPEVTGRHKKRLSTSIGNLFSNLQLSPRKSEHSSAADMEFPVHALRRSEPSRQEQDRVGEERSARGLIEARAESRKTGKVPSFGHVDDPVVITTDDLRDKCREVTKKTEPVDFPRSLSTRKLFSTIKNSFKPSSEPAPPEMPDKAAQVLGTTERKVRKILPRPIKPSRVLETQAVESGPAAPPTPPAKDTPPRAGGGRQTTHVDTPGPSVGQAAMLDEGDAAVNTGPHHSADMTVLIEGSPLEWPLATTDDQATEQGGDFVLAECKQRKRLHHARPEAVDDELLQPRFYSPPGHTARSFAPGESPSRNSDATRMLFEVPSQAHQPSRSNESNDSNDSNDSSSKDGSIRVMFVGDPNEIDRGSSTAKMLEEAERRAASAHARDDATITTRVMQELRLSDHAAAGATTSSTQSQANQSSSRLTDLLRDANPQSHGWNREFRPNCPSAVPSPLSKVPASPLTPGRSAVASPSPLASWPAPTRKSMEEHFFMTNEHLDVVGKTTWDILEMAQQQHLLAVECKYEKLTALLEKRFEEVNSKLATVNDKADGTAEKIGSVHDDLAKVGSFMTTEISGAFQAQEKKMTSMEDRIKELQTSVQSMQKLLEQRTNEYPSGQAHLGNHALTPNPAHSPYAQQDHRAQPSLAGYYGHAGMTGRESHGPMQPMHENHGGASPQHGSHGAQGGGYDEGNGRQWGSRAMYPVRGSSREGGRGGYAGTNPYQFATGGPFSGGYSGGYSYNYSPTPSDAQHGFGSGQGK